MFRKDFLVHTTMDHACMPRPHASETAHTRETLVIGLEISSPAPKAEKENSEGSASPDKVSARLPLYRKTISFRKRSLAQHRQPSMATFLRYVCDVDWQCFLTHFSVDCSIRVRKVWHKILIAYPSDSNWFGMIAAYTYSYLGHRSVKGRAAHKIHERTG